MGLDADIEEGVDIVQVHSISSDDATENLRASEKTLSFPIVTSPLNESARIDLDAVLGKLGEPTKRIKRTPKGQCRASGCLRKKHAKGLCSMHYRRMRKTGVVKKRPGALNTRPACRVKGCPDAAESRVYGSRYCSKHMERKRKYGNPLWVQRLPQSDTCVICGRPMYRRNWCKGHYASYRKHKDPLTDFHPRENAICSVDGCVRGVYAKDLCENHYQQSYIKDTGGTSKFQRQIADVLLSAAEREAAGKPGFTRPARLGGGLGAIDRPKPEREEE